ncbi:MAG: FHA domain-containing protein [Myxococcales bacterium]|nr:FHA domain-containing protein [Myxococcales bacterium]
MDDPPSPDAPSWQLRILSGPLRGTMHPLVDRFGIGRSSGSDLVLVHESVSRQHAHIALDEHGLHVVVDLVSSNGTFVDGRRIEREVLRPHAILRIADTEMVYEPAQAPAPTTQVQRGLERVPVLLTGPDGIDHGGRRLDEIIEYRRLRARHLRGELRDPDASARFAALGQHLRPPEGSGERRAFWRFGCSLPAALRLSSGQEREGRIRDFGVDGAQIVVPEHGLEFDEIVWLSLLLEAGGRVREQVLAARVAWVDGDAIGLAFAGAPRAARRTSPADAAALVSFDDGAPTVRMTMPKGVTQDLGPVIGSSPERARHWNKSSS